MELDADEPRKFQGPPDRILGRAGKLLVEKQRFSKRRNLSALAPFGAEANLCNVCLYVCTSSNIIGEATPANPPAAF